MEPSELEERLASIELRLSKLEDPFKISPPIPINPPVAGPWTRTAPPVSSQPAASPPVTSEAKPGNWLGIIGVICFVLAAGFIIKLSIETGWLTPARQIGIAALLGLSLVGAGLALVDSDREYASLLPGAGIIVLYLTGFAAHRYYGLVSFEVAIAMTGVVSALCIWLYMRIRHDAYPVTAALGSYIAPAVLGLNATGIFSVYYFVLCSLAFATLSIWVRSRMLTVISAYLAILMTAAVGFDLNQDILVAGFLALQFTIFATGTYLYTAYVRQPLSESEAWSFFPVLLIFYAAEYYLIDRIAPGLAPWVSLGFAGVLVGLYIWAKKWFAGGSLNSSPVVLAFTTVVCFHSVYLELLPDSVRPWLFVLIMLGVAFFPINLSAQRRNDAFRIPALALMAILAIEYMTMVGHLLDGSGVSWLVVSFAAFGSIWTALIVAEDKFGEHDTHGISLLGAAHLLAILGLYRLTVDHGSLAVSASWLFYAVCIIVFAVFRKDGVMMRSALFILSFAAAKALLYDAASAPTVVRILCLLLTGAVLYGSGFLVRKFADWTK